MLETPPGCAFHDGESGVHMKRNRRNATCDKVAAAQLDLFAGVVKAAPVVVAREQTNEEPSKPVVDASLGRQVRPAVDQRLVDFILEESPARGRPPKALAPVIETGQIGRGLLDVREAAHCLGLSKSTLDKMRCSGRGPRFIRASDRAIRYDPDDLKAFADDRRRRSTSEDAVTALRT